MIDTTTHCFIDCLQNNAIGRRCEALFESHLMKSTEHKPFEPWMLWHRWHHLTVVLLNMVIMGRGINKECIDTFWKVIANKLTRYWLQQIYWALKYLNRTSDVESHLWHYSKWQVGMAFSLDTCSVLLIQCPESSIILDMSIHLLTSINR